MRTSPPNPDRRRHIPPTNALLADPAVVAAGRPWSKAVVLDAVRRAQDGVRRGEVAAEDLVGCILALLPARPGGLRPVINATGVVVHTNLGRAPLSAGARAALADAAGYTDVEFDLGDGTRRRRGADALDALRAALPDAGDVAVVNNGAAALVLAVTALAAGREVVWSRGELVEIGDGFRLPDLVASTGAVVAEVGTTNRTVAADYAAAVGPATGCVLKVHPSNFRVDGFTSAAGVAELASLGPPVVVDVGSGLLHPDPLLPDEPDVTTALRQGATVVTASGDKLLGGPQAGLIAGDAEVVGRLRRHPLARALRVDKLTLAALAATLLGPPPPVWEALRADPAALRGRCEALAAATGGQVVASPGVVGGGGAPGVELPGWALSLPGAYAAALRAHDPPVVGRLDHDRCLLDLRCVPAPLDATVLAAVRSCRP